MRKLINGIVEFRERQHADFADRFRELAHGQAPEVLLITCADSRIVPVLLGTPDPGEVFVLRNVGNLVPPATADGASIGDLSEASAIEYSLLVLKVHHLVVCGHSECGAMKAALASQAMPETPNLTKWLHHAASAVFRLDQEGPLDPGLSRHNQLSQLNVLVQLEHLASYPIVRQRMADRTLHLSGWWFDIANGELSAYDRESRTFKIIDRQFAECLLKQFGCDDAH